MDWSLLSPQLQLLHACKLGCNWHAGLCPVLRSRVRFEKTCQLEHQQTERRRVAIAVFVSFPAALAECKSSGLPAELLCTWQCKQGQRWHATPKKRSGYRCGLPHMCLLVLAKLQESTGPSHERPGSGAKYRKKKPITLSLYLDT